MGEKGLAWVDRSGAGIVVRPAAEIIAAEGRVIRGERISISRANLGHDPAL